MRQELQGAIVWRLVILLVLSAALLPACAQPELAPYAIDQETAIPILLRFVRAGDAGQQQQALARLSELQSPELTEMLLAMLREPPADDRVVAARVLGWMGERQAVPLLLAALREEDAVLREAVVTALGRLNDNRAVIPLIAALADKEVMVRKAAALALGLLHDRRAVEPLLAACRDPGAGVYVECIQSLGYLGDPRAVEVLIAALAHADPEVRVQGANGLARITDERAPAPLLAAAGDPDARVREAALQALFNYPDADRRPALIRALADPEPAVRSMALVGIEQFVGNTYDLRRLEDAIEPLIACLDDQDTELRTQAAGMLGRLGDFRAVEPLCRCLENQHPGLVSATLRSLRELRDPRALEPVLRLYAQHPEFQRDIFPLLAEIGGSPVLERLVAELLARGAEGDTGLRTAVAYLGSPAKPLLAAALAQEKDPPRRRLLALLLSRFADLHALDVLLQDAVQREDPQTRLNALRMLGAYASDLRARDAVFAALAEEDRETRRAALNSLPPFQQDPRALPALLAILHGKDAELRRTASNYLQQSDDPRALEALLALRDDPDEYMRQPLMVYLRERLPRDGRVLALLLDGIHDNDDWFREQAVSALADWYARFPDDRERIFTALRGRLGDADPTARRRAATALGALNDIRALDPLLAALQDTSPVVRVNAAVALGWLGDDRAVAPLCRVAGDWYESPRTEAKRALGKLGEPRAIPALVRVSLRELRSEPNMQETTDALRRLGYPIDRRSSPTPPPDAFVLLMSRSLTDDVAGRQALAQLAEPANYEKLLAIVRGEADSGTRYAIRQRDERLAAEILARIGDPRAVEPLAALFDRSTARNQCRSVLQVLMRFHDPRVIPCLLTGLRCEQVTADQIIEALAEYNDPHVTAALRATFTNKRNSEVKYAAAVALARQGDEEVFAELLRNVVGREQYWVLIALGRTGDPRALDALLAPENGNRAINGLTAFLEAVHDPAAYERAVAAALPLIDENREAAELLLAPLARRHDSRATAPLLRDLVNRPFWAFQDRVNLLVATGDPQAVPPLLQLLREDIISRRTAVAAALGDCADPRAVPALIEALQTGPTPVRIQAAASLARLRAPAAIAPLTAAGENDTSARVRAAAVEALALVDSDKR